MEATNNPGISEQWWQKAINYIVDALTGPSISAFLITFTLNKPSELLSGIIDSNTVGVAEWVSRF